MNSPSPLFDLIFALWPNPAAMASDMHVTVHCARYWIARGRIPINYWPLLIRLCATKFDRELTFESLMMATIARRCAPERRVKALGLYRRKEEGQNQEAA